MGGLGFYFKTRRCVVYCYLRRIEHDSHRIMIIVNMSVNIGKLKSTTHNIMCLFKKYIFLMHCIQRVLFHFLASF